QDCSYIGRTYSGVRQVGPTEIKGSENRSDASFIIAGQGEVMLLDQPLLDGAHVFFKHALIGNNVAESIEQNNDARIFAEVLRPRTRKQTRHKVGPIRRDLK